MLAMQETTERGVWFEHEVERLLPDLLGAALRMARNEADAQDLVADAVARAWLRLDDLQDRNSLRGWMFRILTNGFISRYRAEAACALEPYEEHADDESFALFDRLHQPILLWWHNPEREFLNRLLREDLERAVDGLPEPYRLVVVLADLQGLSYRELADALGIPIGTVRSRLARARAHLQNPVGARRGRGAPAPRFATRGVAMTEQAIDCQRALRMLAAYLDGELEQADQGDVRRHLDTCRSCYSRMEFETQLKERLAELGRRVPEPAFSERIRQVVRQFTQAKPGAPGS